MFIGSRESTLPRNIHGHVAFQEGGRANSFRSDTIGNVKHMATSKNYTARGAWGRAKGDSAAFLRV
jgi:hypothetical protein